MKDWTNCLLKCDVRLLKLWLYLTLDYFKKKIAKMYKKQQIVNMS